MTDRPSTPDDEALAQARERMLEAIDAEVAETAHWLGTPRLSARVREAIAKVPRHRFVDAAQAERAYDNRPLPIGQGQTISQPYIVAAMTELANPDPDDRVLEIGTGCGYQTAILAELAAKVFTVEAVRELHDAARERLGRLGYENVVTRFADGSQGWPEKAPFDAIVVTAAAPPGTEDLLARQLAPGGRLVLPVQQPGWRSALGIDAEQELHCLCKDRDGTLSRRRILPVAFVPLTRG